MWRVVLAASSRESGVKFRVGAAARALVTSRITAILFERDSATSLRGLATGSALREDRSRTLTQKEEHHMLLCRCAHISPRSLHHTTIISQHPSSRAAKTPSAASSDGQPLDDGLLSAEEVVLGERLQLVRHQHTLRARDDAHIVDEEDGRQPVDLEDRRDLRLLVRADL